MNNPIVKIYDCKCFVDLIILSHNTLDTTKSFLDFLHKNTDFEKVHVLMIDNGSSDNTQSFLQDFINKFSNFSLILNNKNLGVIGGRNQGYHFCKKHRTDVSKYIMHLDNDQFVQRGWLEQHICFLESGGYDLVGVEAWQMNSRFLPVRKITNKNQSITHCEFGSDIFIICKNGFYIRVKISHSFF